MNVIRDIPLVGTAPVAVMVAILVVAAAAALFMGAIKRIVIAAIAAAIATGIVWVVLSKVWKPFPDAIPAYLYIAGWVAVFILVRALIVRGHRVVWMAVFVVAALCASGLVNNQFNVYRAIGDFDPKPVTATVSYEQFQAMTAPAQLDGRDVGVELNVALEATVSGFHPRDAVAYVPPAYWTHAAEKFPVIVLMAGSPGNPNDWFKTGIVQKIADEFQESHDGKSPIVISVDGTGGYADNPACVDGARGNVQTYLATDVPAAIKATFRVTDDQKTWTIGGLSYGGTCSLQVMSNAPSAYGSFLDFSGQAEPTLGNHEDTVNKLFAGNEASFEAVDPAHILQAAAANGGTQFEGIEGKFVAGTRDKESQRALSTLNDLATKAGMTTEYTTVYGGHDFGTWRTALDENFAWAAARGGLT